MPERCLQPLLGPLHQMRGDGREAVDRPEQTEEERQGLSGEEPSVVHAVVVVRGPEDSHIKVCWFILCEMGKSERRTDRRAF